MTDDPARAGRPSGGSPGISPLTVAQLRVRAGSEVDAIAGIALDAVIPSVADAAVVFAAERLLRGDGLAMPDGKDPVAVRRVGTRFAGDGDGAGDQVPTEAFPTGEVLVPAADSPYGQCLRLGEPAIFSQLDSKTLADASHAGREVLSRFTSYLAAPMIAGDTVSGFLALAREPGRAAFGDDDIALVAPLAAHTGTGIVNAATLARHQAIANVLQRGLLAVDPPRPAHLEVAGRCVPAAGNLVGGDWYDVIPLPEERTGLIVGDVMGHGPEAAAAMAQLRTAAHALAQLDLEPSEVLTQLDRTILTLRGVPLATCVYAVIDPGSQSCVLATAGHLPPVLALPDGVTRILDMPTGQSLGIGPAIYGQARIKLKPGAILALFTDGLVETRTRSFDQGVSALRSELGRGGDPLEARCDALLPALAHEQEDDVTLILARLPRKAQ